MPWRDSSKTSAWKSRCWRRGPATRCGPTMGSFPIRWFAIPVSIPPTRWLPGIAGGCGVCGSPGLSIFCIATASIRPATWPRSCICTGTCPWSSPATAATCSPAASAWPSRWCGSGSNKDCRRPTRSSPSVASRATITAVCARTPAPSFPFPTAWIWNPMPKRRPGLPSWMPPSGRATIFCSWAGWRRAKAWMFCSRRWRFCRRLLMCGS